MMMESQDDLLQRARVYVGNLPPDTDQNALREQFMQHGNVQRVNVFKGFAFVQFQEEIEAQTAINEQNGQSFMGRKIDVRVAVKRGGKGQQQQGHQQPPQGPPPKQQQQPPMQGSQHTQAAPWQQPPPPQQQQKHVAPWQQQQHFQDQQQQMFDQDNSDGPSAAKLARGGGRGGRGRNRGGGARGGGRGGSVGGNGGGPNQFQQWQDNSGNPFGPPQGGGNFSQSDMSYGGNNEGHDYYDNTQDTNWTPLGGGRGRGGPRGGRGAGRGHSRSGGGPTGDQHFAGEGYGGGGSGGPAEMPPFQPPPPASAPTQSSSAAEPSQAWNPSNAVVNDCEIVCVNRNQRYFAEGVEQRLKRLGLEVDILFPNPDIPLSKIFGNISSRGVLFAVLITPLNEEHRSLTVNVLQGQQQEHRNMPMEDAMSLMATTFERQMELKAQNGGLGDRHPSDVVAVMGIFADHRPMSVMEYDKLIKYLCTRREQMLRLEYGDAIPTHLATPPIGPQMDPALVAKQEELKAKILSVLNKPKESASMPKPGPSAVPSSSSGADPSKSQPTSGQPMMLNESLRKAIDSLVKTGPNLLTQIITNPPQMPTPQQQQPQSYQQQQQQPQNYQQQQYQQQQAQQQQQQEYSSGYASDAAPGPSQGYPYSQGGDSSSAYGGYSPFGRDFRRY